MQRHNAKAVHLGVGDPFNTQIMRFNTGAEYGSSMIQMKMQQEEAEKNRKASEEMFNKQMTAQQLAEAKAEKQIKPYQTSGLAANKQIAGLQGFDDEGNYNPDALANAKAKFQVDPGYDFAVKQGIQARDRSAAAGGRLNSGSYDAEMTQFGQGVANQQYDSYYSRLMNSANLGWAAASKSATQATSYGDRYMGLYGQQGQAQMNYNSAMANSVINAANRMAKYTDETNQQVVNTGASLAGTGVSAYKAGMQGRHV